MEGAEKAVTYSSTFYLFYANPTLCLLPPLKPSTPPFPNPFKRLPTDPPKTLITFPKNSYIRSNKRKPIAIINTWSKL